MTKLKKKSNISVGVKPCALGWPKIMCGLYHKLTVCHFKNNILSHILRMGGKLLSFIYFLYKILKGITKQKILDYAFLFKKK